MLWIMSRSLGHYEEMKEDRCDGMVSDQVTEYNCDPDGLRSYYLLGRGKI